MPSVLLLGSGLHASDYGADPSTLVVCGGSAGAYLGTMCALTADDPTFQPGFEQADTSVSAAVGLYGYYGSAPSSEHSRSAPDAYLRSDTPPFFAIHGARDPMTAAAQARQFVERLRKASNGPVLYAELPGGQHNFDQFPPLGTSPSSTLSKRSEPGCTPVQRCSDGRRRGHG